MKHRTLLLSALAAFALVWSGCDRSTDPGDAESVLDEDVATAVAGAVSEEGGGIAAQLEDLAFIASSAGLQFSAVQDPGMMSVAGGATPDTSYDDATGWWTATISRQWSSQGGLYQFSHERTYQFQFLNKNGAPQRRYIVSTPSGPDTAYTINFKVLNGSGYHRTPFRVHILESLTTDYVVTTANTNVLTINGTMARSAKDTLKTRESTRTHANQMTATLINVRKPRYRAGATRDSLSGTITGTYQSQITFTRGDLYRERSVSREFTVELSGSDARIGVGGRRFRSSWMRGDMLGLLR